MKNGPGEGAEEMEREVEMKLPSKRKKKSPIGTSFRRVAISLLLVSETRRDAAYIFFRTKLWFIKSLSLCVRFSLVSYSFPASASIGVRRVDDGWRSGMRNQPIYTTSLSSDGQHSVADRDRSTEWKCRQQRSREISFWYRRESAQAKKKGQEEIHLCSFFYITSSWAFRSVLTTMLPTLAEAWMSYVDWESKVRKLTCFTLCLLLRYITVRDDDDDDVGESVRRVFSPRLAVLTLRNPPRIPKLQRFFTLNFLFFPTSFFRFFQIFFSHKETSIFLSVLWSNFSPTSFWQ